MPGEETAPKPLTVQEEFFAMCDELGELEVRSRARIAAWGGKTVMAERWLALQELKRAAQAEARANRAVDAAERSAKAAEDAAVAAKASARWTLWTAIVALVTVAASVLGTFLLWLFS